MNKSYESKSAIIILYGSSEYKTLDKKLNGQLDTMCQANSIDSKDTLETEMTYPSKVNTQAICVIKTDKDSDKDWRNIGGKYYNRYMWFICNHLIWIESNIKNLQYIIIRKLI